MDNATMNIVIASYLDAKESEARAKKEKERLANLIKDELKKRNVETELYTVFIEKTESIILDTKTLYNDFPDIKETYGKKSVKESIKVFEKALEKSA